MLRSTALGVPRFSIISDRRSCSTRFSSFPKFARARKTETTIGPFLPVVVVVAIHSPFQLFELYSLTGLQSTGLVRCSGRPAFFLRVINVHDCGHYRR